MTATETETMTEEQLLEDFKGRWSALREENQKLAAKVRDNEQQMLKLQGAIETLEYLGQNTVDEADVE